MNRKITKVEMPNKYKETFSASQVIRVQIKTVMKILTYSQNMINIIQYMWHCGAFLIDVF